MPEPDIKDRISLIKHERVLILFSLIGFFILAFIILTLANTILTQVLLDLDGFIKTTRDPSVWDAIFLSAYTAFLATAIAFLSGVPLAYVLARGNFIGKGLIEGVIDLPIVIPHTVAGIALLTVFGRHGLIGQFSLLRFVDAVPGIVVAMLFVSAPFLINSAREGFESVDPRLENVARSLGASGWRTFCRITFPLASRHLLTGAIMCWARAVSEFGAVVVIAYHPMIAPTLIYERYISAGLSASRPVSVLLIIFCLVIFVILRILARKR